VFDAMSGNPLIGDLGQDYGLAAFNPQGYLVVSHKVYPPPASPVHVYIATTTNPGYNGVLPYIYAFAGSEYSISAYVDNASYLPAGTFSGTITFREGDTILGRDMFDLVTGQQAQLPIGYLTVGTHDITAVYESESAGTLVSPVLVQVVTRYPSSTAIASTVNPAQFGDANGAITASAACDLYCNTCYNYDETITFKEGETILATGIFNRFLGTKATLPLSSLSVGSHTITAVYGGLLLCSGSSASLTQTISAVNLPLNVTITGSGNVHGHDQSSAVGVPSDIACSRNTGACSAQYLDGDTIILTATPEGAVSVFEKWGGACSGTVTSCSVIMNGVQNVSANFIQAQLAKNDTTGLFYPTLAEALTAANLTVPDVLMLLSTSYDGAIVLSKGVTLKGGWEGLYQTQTGQPTTLNNGLIVQGGYSKLEFFNIKGSLGITGGTLWVNGVTVE
jgi:hypothetical protein